MDPQLYWGFKLKKEEELTVFIFPCLLFLWRFQQGSNKNTYIITFWSVGFSCGGGDEGVEGWRTRSKLLPNDT